MWIWPNGTEYSGSWAIVVDPATGAKVWHPIDCPSSWPAQMRQYWGVVWEEPAPANLADTKSTKQAEIRDLADGFLQALAVEYGAMEKLTWDQQAAEADALAADPSAQAPLVRSIAAARGMNPLELAARIQANRAQWVVLSGYIVGQRLGYQDRLDAATTTEQVAAIVPTYALP